jgi:uncharacterized damage-inducible protein DinB
MPKLSTDAYTVARTVLLESFTVNDAVNQLLLENLNPRVWRAQPPARGTRTIAAIFSHLHNVRRKWLRLTAPHLRLPAELDRAACTQRQASSALAQSAKLCSQMLAEALGPNPRVKQFLRDGWARPWPAGAAMVVYIIAHEAHHRGQICMLTHQLGYPLPPTITSNMWSWEKLWKHSGFTRPR